MSRLTGMQIVEIMTNIRDSLIVESLPPSWTAESRPAAPVSISSLERHTEKPSGRRSRKGAAVMPLWLGRAGWIAAAVGTLVAVGLVVGLIALRDGRDEPSNETEGESVSAPLEELSGFDAANRLLEQLTIPAEGTHMKLDTTTNVRVITEYSGVSGGFRQHYASTVTLAGKEFDLTRTPDTGDTERFTYKDGRLYVTTSEGATVSSFSDEDVLTLAALLREDMELPSEQPFLSAETLFERAEIKPSDTGTDVVVVCTGLRTEAIENVIPLVRPTLEYMGLVTSMAYDEETGEICTDYKEADQQTRELLALAKGDSLTVTLTAAADGTLKRISVTARLTEESYTEEMGNVLSEIELKSDLTPDFRTQRVSFDRSKSYTEKHWRLVFNFPNAESVGLIPDENGIYHITATNSPTWNTQIQFLMDHPDELIGKSFHVVGYSWGVGGPWTKNRYTSTIHGSNKDGVCIYAPTVMPYELFEANQTVLQNTQKKPKMEIYGTLTIEDWSLDGTSTSPVFTVERIVFP